MKEKTIQILFTNLPKLFKEIFKPLLLITIAAFSLLVADVFYCRYYGYKKQINFLNKQYALGDVPLYACYKHINSNLSKMYDYKNGLHFEHGEELVNRLTLTDYALSKRGYSFVYLYNINRGISCKIGFHKKPLTQYIRYVIMNLESYNTTLFWRMFE